MKAHEAALHAILIGLLTSSVTAAAQSKNPIEAAKEAWRKAREEQRQQKEQREPQQQRKQKPGQQQAPGQAQAADSGPIVPPAGTKIEETVLAPVRQGAHFSLSPRGVHAAATGSSGSRQVVIYEGVEGPKFDEILAQEGSRGNQAVFSPDGKRYAYCARAGNEFVVMVDGKELARSSESHGGRFDGNLCALGFTSNSKHVYYTTGNVTTTTGQRYSRFVFDGKPGAPNEDSMGIFPVFSPDGEHFAYIWNDPAKQKPWALIVDGKPAGYQGSNPQWSADSQHLFTQIQFPMGPGRGMGTEVLLDGKPIMRAQGVRLFIPPVGDMLIALVNAPIPSHVVFLTVRGKKIPGSDTDGLAGAIDQIVFSADGKHFAAKYRTSTNTQYVMVDGKKGLEYQTVDKLSFTADSTKAVYQASNGGKMFVVVGEQESDGAPGVMEPVLAPVGNRVGSFYGGGGAPQLFMDGKTTRIDGRAIEKLSFSPDGAHYAYVVYDAGLGRRLMLDGIVQPASNLGPSNAPIDGKYVFSPDGRHIAHFALPPTPTGDGERGLFLDGKYVPLGQGLICSQLTFTPDGRHLFWLQQVPSQNRIRIFADGKPVAETYTAGYPASMPGWWELSPEGTLSFLGQDDTSLKRISITPSPETSLETLLTRAR